MKDDKHTTHYHARNVKEIIEALDVNPKDGLSEPEVRRRCRKYGSNELQEGEGRRPWRILLDQFKSMVIIVLVIAGVVAFSFSHLAEGVAIIAVLFVNAAIGFVTEWKAVSSMESLRANTKDLIRVRREGEEQEIDSKQLTPGDIIIIEAGDMVPADVRLVESNQIRVNEAALTGESVPVRKRIDPAASDAPLAERFCMLYKGTTVTEGSGEGVVVGTGMQTELGRISELAQKAEKAATPLQKRLDQLGRRLAWITIGLAVVIAGVGLLAGQETFRMIETAIALGVAAIPEGLPIVSTIALARGMHLMARRNVLINKLPSVETLGATQVIFTDKTGTLTENRMTLRKVVSPAGEFEPDEADAGRSEDVPPLVRRIIETGVLCNNASLRDTDNDQGVEAAQGDPTEAALLRAGVNLGLRREALLEKKPEMREAPFDPERMMMATFHQGAQGVEVAVKGAPLRVLSACSRITTKNGEDASDLTDDMRRKWENAAESLAGEGFRVLAMADKAADSADESPYEALRFLGVVGLLDPPRKDVRRSIRECQAAGVRVVMITGDKAATAGAVGAQTGITEKDGTPSVIRGNELNDPDDMTAADRRRIAETGIFARVSPAQKLHLVKLMQEKGLTIAMTGDGVNDAPALKKADIGIAMGQRGTDAAREVSDMVLRDDAFSSIVAAVRQGRIIFKNIRKSVMFMLCTNVAEVIAVALAAVVGGFSRLPLPLLPLQILYLNVITDVFPALALGMSKGAADIMERPPRPQEEPVLTKDHWTAVAGWAVLIAACVLGGLAVAFYGLGFEKKQAVTVSFLTLAFAKLWFVFNLRDPGARIFANNIVQNPYVLFSIALCTVLLIMAVYLPGLSFVLKTEDPGLSGWLLLLLVSLIPFAVGQGVRLFQGRLKKRRGAHR